MNAQNSTLAPCRRYVVGFAWLFIVACYSPLQAATSWGNGVLRQAPEWYRSAEAKSMADTVLQYQSPQGAWPKNTDLAEPPRSPDDIPSPGGGRANSLDNGATTLPIMFLAHVISATHESTYRESFDRGIDYLLAAQYPNGGWPQFWPLRKGYYSRITYNDNAMVRVMTVLRDVAEGQAPYGFVSGSQREEATEAVRKGIDCILKTQVIQNGQRTVWCAQHDEVTLKPAWARAYEPPSLSGGESVGVLRFLMSVENPSAEIMAAIEGAAQWLSAAEMKGFRIERIRGGDGRTDRKLISDPKASGLWARFYELGTNRPLYLDRDSVFRYDFSEISYERRSGYSYHGSWAAPVLKEEYPEWRKKHELPE